MKMVYMAGSIDGHTPGERPRTAHWRDHVAFELKQAGIAAFNPAKAFSVAPGSKNLSQVQLINDLAIDQSSALIVEMIEDVPRVGTFMEIGRAIARGIPVILWAEDETFANHVSLQHHLIQRTPFLTGAIARTVEAVRQTVKPPPPGSTEVPNRPAVVYAFDPPELAGQMPPLDRAYKGDAGMDLPVSEAVAIPPNSFADVPLAVRVAPPPGYWFRLVGRSSTLRKRGLLVNEGIIDQGWRGRLFAGVWNMTDEEVRLEPGDRIVQAIFERVHVDEVEVVQVETTDELPWGERGERGFGSTGQAGEYETEAAK